LEDVQRSQGGGATDKDLLCINGVLKLTSNAPELNDVRRKTKNRNNLLPTD